MVLSIVLSFWMVVAVLWLMPVLRLILTVFFYKKQTDDNGMARLNINLFPGEYILTAIHLNGEEKSKYY